MKYTPCPIDTSSIQLPHELDTLLESLAENTHAIWARKRVDSGWRHGARHCDIKKTNPNIVPYAKLPESEKEYDRAIARELLKVLIASGYRIEKPGRG